MYDDKGYIYCTSCHDPDNGMNGMAHSHNLPKSSHPLLETDKANIHPRCLTCHRALDDHDFHKIQHFKDLDVIMNYRLYADKGAYNRFVTGLLEVGCIDYEYVEFDK